MLCTGLPANTWTHRTCQTFRRPTLSLIHLYVNTQRQAVPLWVSAAERKLLNNWQWWAARSQSETNLKRSARDVNSTHINYHWLLACLHRSTDWQLDSTRATLGHGDFGFRSAVIAMSNTCSHQRQVATQLQRKEQRKRSGVEKERRRGERRREECTTAGSLISTLKSHSSILPNSNRKCFPSVLTFQWIP